MIEQKIFDYFNQEFKKGKTKQNINDVLTGKGWQQKDIDQAFTLYDEQKKTIQRARTKKILKTGIIIMLALISAAVSISFARNYSRTCESAPGHDWAKCSECPVYSWDTKYCGGDGKSKKTYIDGKAHDKCSYVTGDGKCWQEYPPYLDMSK